MLFLDPDCRALYPHWETEAARAVASLRLLAGRDEDDRELAELVGDLCLRSEEFAALWARHPVAACVSGTKQLRHSNVGDLTLEFEALVVPDGSGQRLLMYSAAPGTPSRAALALLHHPTQLAGDEGSSEHRSRSAPLQCAGA